MICGSAVKLLKKIEHQIYNFKITTKTPYDIGYTEFLCYIINWYFVKKSQDWEQKECSKKVICFSENYDIPSCFCSPI